MSDAILDAVRVEERSSGPEAARREFLTCRLGEEHYGIDILQVQEITGRFLADKVGPGRQRLPELDRRRADRLESGRIIGRARLYGAETRDTG